MRTLQKLFFAVTVVAAGGLVALGCGGDDTNNVPKLDGSADGPRTPQPEAGDMDGPNNPPPDGGDAGPRDFAAYVVDLITTKTNETTAPTKDLCEGCTDKQDKKDFKALFP